MQYQESPHPSAEWHLVWHPLAFPDSCTQLVLTLGVQPAP